MVKIGFVGCGMMGQTVHLPNFLQVEECEVIALAEVREETGRRVAEKYGIPSFYGSVEKMLSEADIDAVAAILPYTLNPVLAPVILRSAKPLYIEKPMAVNSDDGRKIVEAAAERDTRVMVAYHKRYDPGVEKAKALIDELRVTGELGGTVSARVWNNHGDWTCGYPRLMIDVPNERKPAPVDTELGIPDFIESSLRQTFFGVVGNLCHDVNLMRHLLGDPQRVRHSIIRSGNIYNPPGVTVFDYGDYDVIFESGAVNTHLWDEGVRVNFENGWLELEVAPPLLRAPSQLTLCRAGEGVERPAVEWDWAFAREARHFVESVRDGVEFRSSGGDSCKDLIVFEAMFRAAQEGGPVDVIYGP